MGNVIKRAIILALAIPLSGCVAQILEGAQNECAAFGFQPGSDAYADCVQRQYGARQANIQRTLSNVGQQMATPPSSGNGFTGYLKSSYVSGTSRVCSYDKGGSPYVMTIGVASMCPISVP
jgi:hypothetical protein